MVTIVVHTVLFIVHTVCRVSIIEYIRTVCRVSIVVYVMRDMYPSTVHFLPCS